MLKTGNDYNRFQFFRKSKGKPGEYEEMTVRFLKVVFLKL